MGKENGLGRRQFLKIGGLALIGALAEESNLGYLASYFPEIPGDKYRAVNRMYLEGEIDKETYKSWIKYNGLYVYAVTQGWETAADYMHHYLYGDGTRKDVTVPLISNLSQQNQEEDELDITKQRMHALFENSAATDSGLRGIAEISLPTSYYQGEHLVQISPDMWHGANDMYYALGVFTVGVKGSVLDSFHYDDSLDNSGLVPLTLNNAQIRVNDFYDYAVDGGSVSTPASWPVDITVEQREGELLQDAGLATPFEIAGALQFDELAVVVNSHDLKLEFG